MWPLTVTRCCAQAPGAKKTANSMTACSIHRFISAIPVGFSSLVSLLQLAYLINPDLFEILRPLLQMPGILCTFGT
jgi:hypothetical protein